MMQYSYFEQTDEKLLQLAQMPTEGGIAVAMRTTGYNVEEDEIIELVICDLDGKQLFAQRVKPQNVETWEPSEASGGISPADVAEHPELYQFEDEIMALFDQADIVVCEHLPFTQALVEGSWVTLPNFEGFDLDEEFRLSHCTTDYRTEPATAVSLAGVAEYYGLRADDTSCLGQAKLVAECYRALVAEHEAKRVEKGAAYWEARDKRLAEEKAAQGRADATAALREKRYRQMNGLLWIAGAIIFASLVIQMYQRGFDAGLMVLAGIVSCFCLARGIINLKG